jgi:7-cyano-7-deazaguanine synthase in queuosine biosynthesis
MRSKNLIRCRVRGFRSSSREEIIQFQSGTDLRLSPQNLLGPLGISERAADLLDVAATVYQIERQLGGRGRTNPPDRFQVTVPLRQPHRWNRRVSDTLERLLNLLGNATWELEFVRGLQRLPSFEATKDRTVRRVMLLSGGLDSACGAAIIGTEKPETLPVAFYTRQKNLQKNICDELGLAEPNQWRMEWNKRAGRGHSFFYRSFLFLSCAAATAASWGINEVLQFENGVLATAIPPGPSWRMTKHAHPQMAALMCELLCNLLGGDWKISNPFLLCTKQQCVTRAITQCGREVLQALYQTETCWYHWSNRVPGGRKSPGVACGVCIPCILRRTALPKTKFRFDLCSNTVQNNTLLGAAFRAYFTFLSRVIRTKHSAGAFYSVLPAAGRDLISAELLTVKALQDLFVQFAEEFMATYRVRAI